MKSTRSRNDIHSRSDLIRRRHSLMSLVAMIVWTVGCHPPEKPAQPKLTDAPSASHPNDKNEMTDWFVDATGQAGLNFRHDSGATGELLLPEIMGSGAALFDMDRDGDLDLFLVQGGPLTAGDDPSIRPSHRLYRNDQGSTPGGRLHFTDTTADSGIQSVGYGMGVAVGDVDNDGLLDLYVCGLESNQLLRNLGNGQFADITDQAGVDDPRWSSSATFFDYDRDGHLDLFVTNYVAFDRKRSPNCFAPSSARDYCGPDAYPAVRDTLFHNLGGGRFESVTESAGLLEGLGAGLGVIAADLNGDGWCDLYVANDGDPNQLWINQAGTGQFIDEALLAGVALNLRGQAEAGMGVDAADVNGDGKEDLFVTNLAGESNTLYVNMGNGLFEDRTVSLGLRAPSLPFTAFGTRFLDFDHDGDLDLFTINGAVRLQDSLVSLADPNPLRQTSQLLRNDGRDGFRDISSLAGPAFEFSGVGRGACIGDVDNDGDLDLLVTTNNGPARLLLSQASDRTNWLGLRLIDASTGQDLMQTRVEITGDAVKTAWRRVHTDGSYQCASDPRIIFGLGKSTAKRTVAVDWPDGQREVWPDLTANQYHVLKQGSAPARR